MALFSFAQTGDPLRDKLDSIFKFIDKSQIPTGYLKEYGSEMVPLHLFNGLLTDSNNVESLDVLRYVYADLATSKIITALPEKFESYFTPFNLMTYVNNIVQPIT